MLVIEDALSVGAGFMAMRLAQRVQAGPASVWSPLIDLGSFAVGGSLILTQPAGSWARTVGGLQVGVHLAQLRGGA